MVDKADVATLVNRVTAEASQAGLSLSAVAPRLLEMARLAGIDPEQAETPAAAAEAVAAESIDSIADPAPGPLDAVGSADGGPDVSEAGRAPDSLGGAYEEGLDAASRRRFGTFYTPNDVASGLAELALDGLLEPARASASIPRVLDPSCGSGFFLLATGVELHRAGWPAADVLKTLHGVDIDPLALALCEATLRLWAVEHGAVLEADSGPVLVEANYLIDHPATALGDPALGSNAVGATKDDPGANGGPVAWFDAPFDVVVGNPPFLNQLEAATVRTNEEVALLKQRFGKAASGYGDTSALFVLAGLDDLVDGGRLVLVQPDSFVSAAGAAAIRGEVLARSALIAFWDADTRVFDASVYVCAPVLVRGETTASVRRVSGVDFLDRSPVDWSGPVPDAWAELLVGGGAPDVDLSGSVELGTIATATAGFRDQFYGLVPHIVEFVAAPDDTDDADNTDVDNTDVDNTDDTNAVSGVAEFLALAGAGGANGLDDGGRSGRVPLITSGLIEPLECGWGDRPARFAGEVRTAPMVDLASLATDEKLHRWVSERLVPKVLVATQTKVVECFPDPEGLLVPSVPVVAVECDPADVYRIAAALSSPPVSAWAMRRAAGSALSNNALKLSAKQVLAVPLPIVEAEWVKGAELVARFVNGDGPLPHDQRRTRLVEIGRTMTKAYGLAPDDPVFGWWQGRLASRKKRAARRGG